MASLSASSQSTTSAGAQLDSTGISASLKFFVSNLRTLVPTHLTTDNYAIWRSQIIKLLRASGFNNFLAPPTSSQEQQSHDITQSFNNANEWSRTDQNLSAAICSMISPTVLPYVLHLESTAAIWTALETRFQSSNRSKVIQLKNELHNVTMKDQSMIQYLTTIKNLVDRIAAAGSSIDSEDIIMYILNGLSPPYQAFKNTIRTMQSSLSLDNFYSLLISEEIHVQNDLSRNNTLPDPQTALYIVRSCSKRSRG
ncbi:hypothetical protein KFK09_021587 [Dendrobium nobile]|uniref:Retrovirus-related Pol polyprotein from transposon TNT 1-94 n=1 Tax=Dendrobium nobile TaxID=94219 RepID=A0A8T3ANZ8_DENNO|nr:hypothetical protein KFK09_021587 [Dendrobium nobile]